MRPTAGPTWRMPGHPASAGHLPSKAVAGVLAAWMSWMVPAIADQPPLHPSRDVDVTYRAAAPQGGPQVQQRVRWRAASQIMRIDLPAPGLYVIIDYIGRRMRVVRDGTRSVIEMAAPDSMTDMIGSKPATSYTRRGEATVAGRTCTEWQTVDRDARPALVCVTDDGVLLRAGTPDQVRVSAVSVHYAPQDPTTFHVPDDYVRQAPPTTR
jgi:hypothetical protein